MSPCNDQTSAPVILSSMRNKWSFDSQFYMVIDYIVLHKYKISWSWSLCDTQNKFIFGIFFTKYKKNNLIICAACLLLLNFKHTYILCYTHYNYIKDHFLINLRWVFKSWIYGWSSLIYLFIRYSYLLLIYKFNYSVIILFMDDHFDIIVEWFFFF